MSVPTIRAQLLDEGREGPLAYTIRQRFHETGKHGCVARKIAHVSKANMQKGWNSIKIMYLKNTHSGIKSCGLMNP